MNESPKYNRLLGFNYTTGDSQQYTREYTWEDWVAASRFLDRTPDTKHANIIQAIYDFFKDYPETLLEGGPAKEQGCTIEQLNIYFQEGRYKPVWWIQARPMEED